MKSIERRVLLSAACFVLLAALIPISVVFRGGSKTNASDGDNQAVTPEVAQPRAPRADAAPAPATAAWNVAATPAGFAAQAAAAAANAPPRSGDPLPAHLDKLWPGGTFLARHDKAAPFGTERVSIIQPADLPYPVRIQEYYPKNGDPVLVSEVIADRVLVGKPVDIPHEKFVFLLARFGPAEIKRLTEGGVYQIIFRDEITHPDTVPNAVARLRTRFPVRYAEPDPVQRVSLTPNDPLHLDGTLWGMHNTGQNSGTADADIDAPEAWDVRTSAENIVVGVVDTGVLYTHEDIAANMWTNPGESGGGKETNGLDDDGNGHVDDVHGINAISNSGDPKDDHGHGSHCSGTIAGVGNNGVGVAGVAWNTRIMALKFLSAEGSGALSDGIECIEYARLKGADLTSNSWGGGAANAALESAIRDLTTAGKLFVVAAGNDGSNNDITPVYPSSYPISGLVSVAATDRTDALAYFSNYGLGTVHIGAPGVAITSLGIANNSDYRPLSGTSMATPHVAGVVAMLMAQFPTDTAGQILNRLYRSADPTTALAYASYSGGRLNLRQALTTTSNAPFNDDFAQARVLNRNSFKLQTTFSSATAEASNLSDGIANGPAVWYRVSVSADGRVNLSTAGSSFDTLLGVYTGSSVSALTPVATNDDSGGSTSALGFDATANTPYFIAVAGKNGGQGLLQLAMEGPVVNDHLANATPLNVMGGDGFVGNNLTATKEPGEANHAGNSGGKSVWAKFTAPVSGYYTVTSGGEASFNNWSSFDTLVAVYAGPATDPTHASLVPVASNDNDPSGYFNTSLLGFHATAGQTYYVALDGKNGASGDTRLLVFPIGDHDYFEHAMLLEGDEHVINTSNRIATTEPGEPDHSGYKPRYTLWYDFRPETSGTFEIDTVSTLGTRTDHNTSLTVYTGDTLGGLTQVVTQIGGAGDFDSLVTFNATAGQSYKVVTSVPYNSNAPLLGPSGLRVRKVEPILNDHFAEAITVPHPAGRAFSTVSSRNRGATLEAGEPSTALSFGAPQNTIWWKWTADRTAKMQVNTIGSNNDGGRPVDTVLWVFSGNTLGELTQIAFDDDTGGSFTSLATFDAVAGTTYYFRVAGWGNASGNINLNLGEHFVPGDNFVDAIAVEPDFFFRFYDNGAATRESGEPLHAGVTEQSRSLWFKFTATAETVGPVAFSTMGSQDTVVAVYTGSAINALTAVTSTDDFSGRWQAEVKWTAVAGTTYYIVVALGFEGGNPFPYCVTFQPIKNDAFASAMALAGDTHSVSSHNFGATKETGEPSHAGNSGGRSVWFNWTPSTSGTFRISTIGSMTRIFNVGSELRNMDTLLGVYTGPAVNTLAVVASNNDFGYPQKDTFVRRGVSSEVYLDATSGTTYRIAVDGHNGTGMTGGDWGQIKLDIAPTVRPANDSFANAEVIPASGLPFLRTVDLHNYGATTEVGEPTHAGSADRSKGTLWFSFTAPETRTYFASTAGNLYDDNRARNTVVAVYTGSAVGSLTQIAADNESLGLGSSQAQFAATAGTTYRIAIGSQYAGPMSFMLVPAPANDTYPNATQVWGSNFSAVGYNVGATRDTGELDPYEYNKLATSARRSVWWKWTAPVTGTYSLDTYNSDLWVQLSIHGSSGPAASALWVETGVVSDPLNMTVTGRRDLEDRRARGTMNTSFTFVAGQTYWFRVAGGGYYGDHAGTIRLDVSGPPAIPPAPLALNASRSSASAVLLNWQDLSNDETAHVLERSLDGSAWSALATLPANTVNYLDSSVPEADVHYRLCATNALGASAWTSTFVRLPAPPPAPANFSGIGTSMTSTSLTWNAVADATSLRLERSATGHLGPWTVLNAALAGSATTYSDSGLVANKTYWYRLRATNTIGTGPWSQVAAVTTLNSATLVQDPFSDGASTNGADPLDIAWKTESSTMSVVTDAGLDPSAPGQVLQASVSAVNQDAYLYFTLPQTQTLAVGQSLKLSFKLRHTGTPRADNSRTGFSIAYTPANNPWPGSGNREYMVRTSWGTTSNVSYLARTSDVQLVNSSGIDVFLANNLPAVNAGTSATSAWLEIQRTGESSIVLRAQLGANAIVEAADTGAANGSNSGIITTFNRVYFRFRTLTDAASPDFLLDDVVVTKTLAGTPEPGQHPITAWRMQHFGTTENSGIAADDFDADGDGVVNLLEYALGTLPASAASRPVIESGISNHKLQMAFTPATTDGLSFHVEASPDLSDWSEQTDITNQLTPGELYIHTDSVTAARRFMCLRVMLMSMEP